MRVDATKLPFRKEDGRNRDDLTLVVGLFDQNGNFISALQKTIELRLKDQTLSAWMQSGIENSTDFTVKPGKYLVRLVVRDSGSDRQWRTSEHRCGQSRGEIRLRPPLSAGSVAGAFLSLLGRR